MYASVIDSVMLNIGPTLLSTRIFFFLSNDNVSQKFYPHKFCALRMKKRVSEGKGERERARRGQNRTGEGGD